MNIDRLHTCLPTLRLPLAAFALCATAAAQDPCHIIAFQARAAAAAAAQADLHTALGSAENIAEDDDRTEAVTEAFVAFGEELDLIAEQYDRRMGLCARLGGGRYAPEIDPADFVGVVDNPLLPFLPGATRTYEKDLGNGDVERIEITVLTDTREIMGVTCTTVRDVARENGEVIEDTIDYYAQDVHGNVWYFGEIAMNYEDGFLTDLDGSWIAGEDGAQPGIVMFAAPEVGRMYRQEFLLGEAEDAALVTSIGAQVTVPAGTFTGCVSTYDVTPIEPDAAETKVYAPGVGAVLEIDRTTGQRLELITYTP